MLDIFRREIKYEINPCLTEVLKQRLSAVLPADPHNGTQGYLVRSVYFDTPDASDCREKLDGVENRKKLRLRVYGFGDAPAKLELKQKQGAFQRKRSLTLSRPQAEQLLAGDSSCLEDCGEFGQQMARLMALGAYRPSCLVCMTALPSAAPPTIPGLPLTAACAPTRAASGCMTPRCS